MSSKAEFVDQFQEKIKALNDIVWEKRLTTLLIRDWLAQFQENVDLERDEQLHAFYLLSHFVFFGQSEIRELLKSIYRDLFRSPIIYEIRKANSDTVDRAFLDREFGKCLYRTRFIGVGNPSESGAHLLYYFRQENALPKTLFINAHEIFKREQGPSGSILTLRDPTLEYYVFLDDLCGSGNQASDYSKDLVAPLKNENPKAKVFYFVLFGMSNGLTAVRNLNCFDKVAAVYELDMSFKTLESDSRLFNPEESPFIRERIKSTCEKYGKKLWNLHPLGFKDGQLLLGFNHNTPDNTLPIFWSEGEPVGSWLPIFKRYDKDYGW
jgi:hypothetical protein